ncbi:hypothetical protein ACS0TY_016171 [Phlomoides rotata]
MRIQFFSWLLLIYLFQILCVIRASSQCLDDQRRLLLQLKNSLSFDTAVSTKLVTWNRSADCCSWNGIACDDRSGQVIGLNLESEGISGGIDNTSSLFSLQYLQRLNLAFNNFIGTQIPSGLQNLTNLAYLNLSNAGFAGQVPIEVSTMKRLVVLDLSSIFQTLQPLKLENPNLKKLVENLNELRELHLDYVNVSSQKSEWCQALSSSSLPNLTTLSLRYCGLSGPLDSSLSQLLSLSVLRLEGNNLSTTVPNFFGELSNLTTLILSTCSLQGPFPKSIFQAPTLQILDLYQNPLLSGAVPQLHINSSLRTMLLGYTNFSGTLPESIGNLRMLSKIDISNCNFTGMIPPSISNLTELIHLDFSFNSFTGTIPLFHMSKKLAYLDLSRNSLTGSLTSKHFEDLSKLESISLVNNSLNGSIPASLFALPSLQKLQLSNNKFSSQISEFPISFTSLDTLDLSSNHLGGPIPDSFFKLEKLKVISLSSNFFNGTVKLEIIQRLHNLTRLDLGSNNLSIDISSSSNSSLPQFPQLSRLNLASCNLYNFPNLRNQSKLTYLDLSNNHLRGQIPRWIWNVGDGQLLHLNISHNHLVEIQKPFSMPSFLGVLDLRSNRLQGQLPKLPELAVYVDYSNNNFHEPIPVNIFNTSYVTFFSLANNSLIGPIPASLCYATYLQVLDLSTNNLSGSIPPCLGNITSLGVLNLRRNNLSGSIPDTFSGNCGLKTLDLSNNKLAGKFPPSLANCTTLEVMNAGNNYINDTFPCSLKYASSLRVLVLRNNKFHGDLNCSGVQGSWINLQIIDIASNNFSGELSPRSIVNWRGMTQNDGSQLRANHLRFDFLNLNNFYYQDAVTVTIKGQQLEFIKILTVFTAIDLSCNNITGMIPKTVGLLTSLYALNLSHNAFTGEVPSSIGNLTQLGSLDLSANQLTGEIPQQLTSLTFLSFLNLSYNKLIGKIPTGSQFQTFSPESYVGNPRLCGFPLNTSCNSPPPPSTSSSFSNIDFNWQFIFTGLGYGVGASLVLAPLVFCKQWREQCGEQVDRFMKLIIPRYGFSYIRHDTKVEAIENIDDETTDDDEDDPGDESSGGRYCIFCTKLDNQIKTAIHNSKCTCHYSPHTFSSTPTSSSSSILVRCR